MSIAHPICVCVCGDDQITCYPGANVLTSEPGDVYRRSVGFTWGF